MRAALVVTTVLSLAGCGRIGFDDLGRNSDARTAGDGASDGVTAIQPIHDYTLAGDYADAFGGPSLAPAGGGFSSGGYGFAANQGLTLAGGLPILVYTVDMVFSFNDVTGWKKVIDYSNLSDDRGLYVYEGALQFVIVPLMDFETTAAALTPDVAARVTLTRDSTGRVTGYMNRVLAPAQRAAIATPPVSPSGTFTFDDSTSAATVSGSTVSFFIDDAVTSGSEAGPGTVRRITIYDVALTAAQIAALP